MIQHKTAKGNNNKIIVSFEGVFLILPMPLIVLKLIYDITALMPYFVIPALK